LYQGITFILTGVHMARSSKFTARDRLNMFKLRAQGLTAAAIGERYGVSHTTMNNQLTDLQLEVAKEAPELQRYMKNVEFILGEKIAMVLDQITPRTRQPKPTFHSWPRH